MIPVIRVDYSQFRTAEEMSVRIAEEYERIANIREVAWPTNISSLGQHTEEQDRQPEPAAETMAA